MYLSKGNIRKRSVAVILSLALINFYHRLLGGYGRPLSPFNNIENKIELHNAIIAGTSTRIGNNYRVLIPYINEIFISILDVLLPYRYSFAIVYAILEFLAISIFIAGFFYFIRIWYSPENSLLGTILMSLSLTTTMTFSFSFHAWSFMEGAILILGMYMIYYDNFYFVILLSLLAVMNRPTGAILPLIYVLTKVNFAQVKEGKIINQREIAKKIFILFIFTAPIFIYLEFIRSINSYDIGFIIGNLANRYAPVVGQDWLASLFALFSFLGFTWGFVIMGFPTLPRFIKRSSLAMLLYVPLIVLTGDPTELRLLIPLYPFIIPAILNVIIADKLLPIQCSERMIRYTATFMIILSLLILSLSAIMSPEIVTVLFLQDGEIESQKAIIEINLFRLAWGIISILMLIISIWIYNSRHKLTPTT